MLTVLSVHSSLRPVATVVGERKKMINDDLTSLFKQTKAPNRLQSESKVQTKSRDMIGGEKLKSCLKHDLSWKKWYHWCIPT